MLKFFSNLRYCVLVGTCCSCFTAERPLKLLVEPDNLGGGGICVYWTAACCCLMSLEANR